MALSLGTSARWSPRASATKPVPGSPSADLAAGSGAVKFQTVQSCNGAGSDSYPWLAGDTVSNGAWKQITGTVDLTACTSVEKLLLFVGADSGDLYLDDVALTPAPVTF